MVYYALCSDRMSQLLENQVNFDSFIVNHAELLDGNLYKDYYSDHLMCNVMEARKSLQLPDLRVRIVTIVIYILFPLYFFGVILKSLRITYNCIF